MSAGCPTAARSSALTFASAEPWSIIREGNGYWKYIPAADGIRFLTRYDYQTRFGVAGAMFDRLVFRPLMGWATAWSFDRLRLWLESRVDPALALRQTVVHAVARVSMAAIFAYQGVVPKLLNRHPDEIAMLQDAGVGASLAPAVAAAIGMSEIAVALALLLAWHRRWPAWLILAAMMVATAVVGVGSPRFFAAAFNPVTLNLAVAALAAIDLLVLDHVPSASRCRPGCPARRVKRGRAIEGDVMTSIYTRALGDEFHRLHPQLQRRFGFSSSDGVASIGRGVMHRIWNGRFYTEPFLHLGTCRHIMFPETGTDIPFTIENYAFVDRFGRETVSWVRTFETPPDAPVRRLHGLQPESRADRRLPRIARTSRGRHRPLGRRPTAVSGCDRVRSGSTKD